MSNKTNIQNNLQKPIYKKWWYYLLLIICFIPIVESAAFDSIRSIFFVVLVVAAIQNAISARKNNGYFSPKPKTACIFAAVYILFSIMYFVSFGENYDSGAAEQDVDGALGACLAFFVSSVIYLLRAIVIKVKIQNNKNWNSTSHFVNSNISDSIPCPNIPQQYDIAPNPEMEHSENSTPERPTAKNYDRIQPTQNNLTNKRNSDVNKFDVLNAKNDMDIIREMEREFSDGYDMAFSKLLNLDDCRKVFRILCRKYEDTSLPLSVQLRFEQLKEEYRPKFEEPNPMAAIDNMNGHDFESYCASILSKIGFINVSVTPGSGDQGVDVIAEKEGVRYAIQCKCYSSNLGNTPIQEVCAGKNMYNCHVGVVMTNRYFTDSAKQLAERNGILLWDREKLMQMIEDAKREFEPVL